MLKNSYRGLFIFMSLFLFQPCLGDKMAQEVIIPGYNPSQPTVSSTSVTTTTIHSTLSVDKLATPGDLDNLIKSVNLDGWSMLSNYLWTCTPKNFQLVQADAKNKLKMRWDELIQKNKIPTVSAAQEILKKLTQPITFRVMGLYGNACQIKVSYPKTDESLSQNFNCFFLIREARSLSQLSSTIAASNGSSNLVPDETLQAFTNLLVTNCHKQ